MSTSALTPGQPRQRARESVVRRWAYTVLVVAVRGRRGRGGDWGEAILSEFDQTRGDVEAVRWVAGGLRAVWHERRARVRQLPRHLRISRRIATIALAGILGGLFIHQFVLTVGVKPSADMEPTLRAGDRYLLDKVVFRVAGIDHGDIVAVGMPAGPGNETRAWTAVKRVIGLPGDTIECRDGHVFRDGTPLHEPYLPTDPKAAWTDCAATTVPDGMLYLLGDRRDVSYDSRHGATFRQDAVQARMLVRVCHCGTEGIGAWGIPPSGTS